MNKVLILLVILQLVICYEEDADFEGGSCTTYTNEPGVCRYLNDCQYAINRLKRKLKIRNCNSDFGIKRIVCCEKATTIMPKEPPEPITRQLFVKLHTEGQLKDGYIDCRFNGTFPIICKRIVHDFTTLRFNEPSQCPELDKPYARSNLSPHELVIYDACYAYSRLGSKCILDEMYADYYHRDNCQRFKSTPKISDGDPAKPMEFPHMAVVGAKKKLGGEKDIVWFGGGTLISEYFILTAAHVLVSQDDGPALYVLLGTIHKNDTRGGELYHIVQRIRYPEYVALSKKNDIALLKLHRRVTFSDYIRPACLTFPGSKENEVIATIVAGWGRTGAGKNTSDILLKAIIYQEYDHTQCPINLHRKFFTWDNITMICAKSKGLRLSQDTCEGDSGGPMMTISNRYVPCSYFVAGIVSWGPKCGEQLYGSYTNSSYVKYQEWIVQHVWPLQLEARKIDLS